MHIPLQVQRRYGKGFVSAVTLIEVRDGWHAFGLLLQLSFLLYYLSASFRDKCHVSISQNLDRFNCVHSNYTAWLRTFCQWPFGWVSLNGRQFKVPVVNKNKVLRPRELVGRTERKLLYAVVVNEENTLWPIFAKVSTLAKDNPNQWFLPTHQTIFICRLPKILVEDVFHFADLKV